MYAELPPLRFSRPPRPRRLLRFAWLAAALLAATVSLGPAALADRPYAPNRQYDLQNVRIELRFDTAKHEVIGQVTHTLAALRDGLRQFDFDSAGLEISSVRVNDAPARFSTDAQTLHVDLPAPTRSGERYEIAIRYQGRPARGLYFILPDRNYPNQPPEIWTQGEAEDTHYYIPIYDYPNDRTTTEMILTVPSDWVTVSNGKLIDVAEAPGGMKTWTWREDQPVSTYLISAVAGKLQESKQRWHGIPVNYYVPRGMGNRIAPTFSHTPDMLSFFSTRFGVPYPWAKYDQTMVDRFVVGGMENVSATTLTVRGLVNPALAHESLQGADPLLSHEMAHQWFGDLVTCKDWGNLWLNEGFATFAATLWEEHEYGADNAAYSRWRMQAGWMRDSRLFPVPIVTHNFSDSLKYAGNIYEKAGLVLQMLREQLGDEAFFRGLQHYLEANRLKNVTTPDLVQALEESTHVDVDRFFDQWVYGAGAPRFAVTSAYDSAAKQLNLTVKQTQKVEGRVGLFDVPVDVVITTSSGSQDFHIRVSQAEQTFSLPAQTRPLMVLFDKGDKILKSVVFQKPPQEWIYQLQHAEDVPARADAARALGALKGNDQAVAALGDAALHDPFWGVRVEVLRGLGRIGGKEAEQRVIAALANREPWVREVAVSELGQFRGDKALPARLKEISGHDPAYRVRSAALSALAEIKAPGATQILEAAARTNSPDDVIRRAALRAMGQLGDSGAVPALLEWAKPGEPLALRAAAIGSLGRLDKKNKAIESQLISFLDEPYFDVRFAALFALGARGDPAAIAPLEALLNQPDLSPEFATHIRGELARLKHTEPGAPESQAAPQASATGTEEVLQRLNKLEQQMAQVNSRLAKIEQSLAAKNTP
jgi:aminopeptidase N